MPDPTVRHFWRYLRAHPVVLGAYIFASLVVIGAVLGPTLAPFSPTTADVGNKLAPPGARHLFGTDSVGLDVFSRVISAPRIDLTIAVVGVIASMVIGVALGLVSGFFDRGLAGAASQLILRVTDMVQSFPVFVLAMALVAAAGQNIQNVILAVAFVNIPFYLRLVNTQVRSLRHRAFVESAQLSGVRPIRTLVRHLLPNAMAPAVAQMSVNFGWAILLTAGLSFAGAGVRPPTAEWGLMISQGAADIESGVWWTTVFPGLALSLTVFSFALITQSVGDLMDPVLRAALGHETAETVGPRFSGAST
jgi:peptide/nickel transport system permease protein